jgi:hypothetical protein
MLAPVSGRIAPVRLGRAVVLASAALAALLLAACTRAAPSSPAASEEVEQRSSALTSNVTVTVVNTAGTPQAGRASILS